jgi:hypothetical protein
MDIASRVADASIVPAWFTKYVLVTRHLRTLGVIEHSCKNLHIEQHDYRNN